jgi:pimeloyl-ACP methyl ester carboxylesterase
MGVMAWILMVHGACHRASCWNLLGAALRGRGHLADAVALPGHETPGAAGLDDGIRTVTAWLAAGAEPAILVGHSLGGMTISGVAEVRPDRVERLVYVAALLPRDGQSAIDLADGQNFPANDATGLDDDGRLRVDPDRATALFYQDCPPEVAAEAVVSLCATDTAYVTTPVALSPGRFGRVPKTYIACRRDAAIPIAAQRAMAAHWPDVGLVELEAGHAPFLSMPERLAKAIAA